MPDLPLDISLTSVVLVIVLLVILRRMNGRKEGGDEEADTKGKRRGPDMAFSAGRDAAHQNGRFQQVFIPMEPDEEPALRAFYLDELGLLEMRAPNYPTDTDGFWAVSGTRQIYFGTRPSFPFDAKALPSFPMKRLKDMAARLQAAGYETAWDRQVSYVERLIVTDPAGTEIALIGG